MIDFRLALLFEWGKWKQKLYCGEEIPMPTFEMQPPPSNEVWMNKWERITHKCKYLELARGCAQNALEYTQSKLQCTKDELQRAQKKIAELEQELKQNKQI